MEFEKLRKIIADVLKIEESAITLQTHFYDDLGEDSLTFFEMIMAVEKEFEIEIPDEQMNSIHTVQDAVDFIRHAHS